MWVVVIIVIILFTPIILAHEMELHRSHKNYSNGIVNHNASFREFVYRVNKSSDEVWSILTCHNTTTSMKYRFNETDHTIVFYSELPDGYLDITYGIYYYEHKGDNILKVVQQNHFFEKNKYAYLQNEFWHQMLDAKPIPYIQQPM